MIEIVIEKDDILNTPSDVLLLKHADGFYGIDEIVSSKLGFSGHVPNGEHIFLHGKNIEARKVLYIGVGELGDFRYGQIRKFGADALRIMAAGSGSCKIVTSPIHGPGYGLDEREVFLSLIAGFTDAINIGDHPRDLEIVKIVERNESRFIRLRKILSTYQEQFQYQIKRDSSNNFNKNIVAHLEINEKLQNKLSSFGQKSDQKSSLFVAMPFSDDYVDEWELAIKESINAAGLLCNRIDEQSYTGDVLAQIKDRIDNANGLIALLNDSNPNVFLEVGYAWAKGKLTVLILKQGLPLPFDIRAQKCIMYKNVTDLRKKLAPELQNLQKLGAFLANKA